jgi:hypothetical protein
MLLLLFPFLPLRAQGRVVRSDKLSTRFLLYVLRTLGFSAMLHLSPNHGWGRSASVRTRKERPKVTYISARFQAQFPSALSWLKIHRHCPSYHSLLGKRRDTTRTVTQSRHCSVRRRVSESHLNSARPVAQARYHCTLSPTFRLLWLNTKRTWEICTPD